MNALQHVFEHSTDAVFGIDTEGRILYANREFEKMLGYTRVQLRNSQCAQVLCGTDIHGRAFCGKNCPIPKTLSHQPEVSDFDLVVRRADGDRVLTNIGASYIPEDMRKKAGEVCVFFSLRRVNPRRLLQRLATAPIAAPAMSGAPGRNRLTDREKEILGLAVKGLHTGQIARRLCVSTQTVRTHFRNIYPKLGVNSRVEAVVFAMQNGLDG